MAQWNDRFISETLFTKAAFKDAEAARLARASMGKP
jgi:hypothetical protein